MKKATGGPQPPFLHTEGGKTTMNNKKSRKRHKKQLKKALKRAEKERLNQAWRNIFVKAGILEEERK